MQMFLCFWFPDDVYAIGGGESDHRTHQMLLYKPFVPLCFPHSLITLWHFYSAGSNDFFLNSIPEQLYGESLSTHLSAEKILNMVQKNMKYSAEKSDI